jgi:anti-sigma factor (TIGR02949 family)
MTSTVQHRLECEEVVQRLWPHLDGALPEHERARVLAHLEGCAGCRSHHDFAAAFLDAVRQSTPASDEFAQLQARVAQAVLDARR